jgi:hypothetical protein
MSSHSIHTKSKTVLHDAPRASATVGVRRGRDRHREIEAEGFICRIDGRVVQP